MGDVMLCECGAFWSVGSFYDSDHDQGMDGHAMRHEISFAELAAMRSGAPPETGETDFRVEQTYEQIEHAIREEAVSKLLEGPPEEAHLQPTKSEQEWADNLANQIAAGVMRQMDAQEQVGAPLDDEEVARAFHNAYERNAPYFGYKTREASAVPWEDVPEDNKGLMIATVHQVRAFLAGAPPEEKS